MRCPCYDTKTKKDCPCRSPTCHANCEAWLEYEDERNAAYIERGKKLSADNDYIDFHLRSCQKTMKKAGLRK